MMASNKPRSTKRAGSSQRANSRQRITQTAKESQALSLRMSGASYQQIALTLGWRNKASAWEAVESALRKTIQEPADQVRALELARLDRWLMAIAPAILAGGLEALDRGLKIMTRRATLLGLDAPAKVAPTTPDGTTAYQPAMVQGPDATFFTDLLALAQELGPQHGNGMSSNEHDPLG
jgi:hypothetical protein